MKGGHLHLAGRAIHRPRPYVAAQHGFVDAVIEPRKTRPALIRALRQLRSKRQTLPAKKHGNLPL